MTGVDPIIDSASPDFKDGIDTSLIDHCLSHNYEERLDAHEAARQLVKELQEAGQKLYEGKS